MQMAVIFLSAVNVTADIAVLTKSKLSLYLTRNCQLNLPVTFMLMAQKGLSLFGLSF